MIIVTSSFSKSSVFKAFSVQTKTQSRRFQFPDPFSRPVSVNIRSNLSVLNFLQRIGLNPGGKKGEFRNWTSFVHTMLEKFEDFHVK